MITIIINGLILLLVGSCAQINQESREHHFKGRAMRHGFIPLEKKTVEEEESKKIISYNVEAADRGKVVYRKNCMECHGQEGEGDGPRGKKLYMKPANLKKAVHAVPDFSFYMSISEWEGEMPGWENVLTDKEIKDVSEYIKSLATK